ncbi:CRE-NHR-156 protein [Caenorhabditis remanei]|uniref:CRE-NHR-156 protein n=1 Tax=Caenorhabditis remanei TaxID=31234 RepID=E3LH97_CAERE|nr:CRE-NHR-156 protein [Caenorhabditis remanei]
MSKCMVTPNFTLCKVCAQPANGNHFGIQSCRACAAFFRRAAHSKWGSQPCRSHNCERKLIPCKPCRLKRCQEQGMSTSNFQFNRDILKRILPRSVEMFVGKPESVIFCDSSESVSSEKTFINVQKLIDNTSAILKNGMETPVSGRNQLQKLANGFGGFTSQVSVKFLKTMSKDETADCWEYYITTTARWLTFFDEFRLLPDELQVSVLR